MEMSVMTEILTTETAVLAHAQLKLILHALQIPMALFQFALKTQTKVYGEDNLNVTMATETTLMDALIQV